MSLAPSVSEFENLNAPRPKGPQRHRSTRHAGEQDHANRQGLEKGEHESKAASGSELREVGIDDDDHPDLAREEEDKDRAAKSIDRSHHRPPFSQVSRRSEERRVGEEGDSKCRSRRWPYH